MPSDTAQPLESAARPASETQTLVAVSAAHLVSHFYIMVLPVLLPLLKERLGVELPRARPGAHHLQCRHRPDPGADGLPGRPARRPPGADRRPAPRRPGVPVARPRRHLSLAARRRPCWPGSPTASITPPTTPSWPTASPSTASAAPSRCTRSPASSAAPSRRRSCSALVRLRRPRDGAGVRGTASGWRRQPRCSSCRASSRRRIAPRCGRSAAGAAAASIGSMLTPTVLGLTGFFTLLALANSAIYSFSVVALIATHGVTLRGRQCRADGLSGGLRGGRAGGRRAGRQDPAPRQRGSHRLRPRRADHAARRHPHPFGAGAGRWPWGSPASSSASIQPSRDMLVRRAAPPGAAGRVFGIVSTGFNIGGIIGPLLFGWMMDHGSPRSGFFGRGRLHGPDRRSSACSRSAAAPQPCAWPEPSAP